MGLLSLTVFIIAACGGEATPAPTATSTPLPTRGPTPTITVAATPTPPPEAPGDSSPAEAKYTWEFSTVDDNGIKPTLAIGGGGEPHIAYMLEAMPGFVNHGVLGPSGWDISTVSEGYFYGPLDIKVDEEGAPHVVWHNHDNEDGAYAILVDGRWDVQGIDHPGHDGWDPTLAIDSEGRPHYASIDPSQSGIEYATVDEGAWKVEEVGSGPVPYEFGTGIILDPQGRPHVVWFDEESAALKHAVKDAGEWDISTIDGDGDVGRFPSLVMDSLGNPAVTYYERVTSSEGHIKYARWDGSQWTTQRVGKLDAVFLGHFGARRNSALVLDEDDYPIVAYSDQEVMKLAWWDGSQWNLETVLTAADSPLGQQVSLGLDSRGVLHLTFMEATPKTPIGGKGIRYAQGTPASP